MSRKGYWRQIQGRQKAGQRDRLTNRLTEKEAQQREERGKQSSGISIVSNAPCSQPVNFPSWTQKMFE